jgi:Dolichyl-phosphate-mannose-protein mannosyltransferase
VNAARLESLKTLVREHKLFSAALAVGAFLRLLAVLGYPGALWFAGDSYVYVGAALRPMHLHVLGVSVPVPQPDLSKSTGYSYFLRALLPFHSFTLVTVIQHLMGLAVAVMIYVLLRRNGVSKIWSTAATLPVLLDGYIIEDEHMIMAESLFTFLLMLALLLILWRRDMKWWNALIAGLLVGYAVDVRTEGAIVLLVFPLFVLVRGWRTHGWKHLTGWLAGVLMAIGCLIPVGAYMESFHQATGHYGVSEATGFYLWGRVSSFADCAVIKPTGKQAIVCPTQPISQRTPPGNWIWHAPPFHSGVNTIGSPVSAANNQLLTDFAIHAVEAQPLGYVKTVVKDTALSFGFPRIAYPGAGTTYYYSFHLHYKTSTYSTLPPNNHVWIPGGTAYQDWLSYGHQAPGRVITVFAAPILLWNRLVFTYGPLLALIFLVGLGGLFTIRRRDGSPLTRRTRLTEIRLKWQPRGTTMLPWVTAVALLVFPIAIADFDYRYLLPVIPFACLAAGLGFAPAKRKAPDQPPPAGRDDQRPVPVQEIDSGATSGVPTSS